MPKQARFRTPGLRSWRHRSDFEPAEAKACHTRYDQTVFVETRGQTDRVGKTPAERKSLQSSTIADVTTGEQAPERRSLSDPEACQSQAVRRFGRQSQQDSVEQISAILFGHKTRHAAKRRECSRALSRMPKSALRRFVGAPDRWKQLGFNVLPGLLAGAQLAGLLLFLNPDIPFSWASFVRATGVLGLLLGLTSAILLTAWSWRKPERAGRVLPWAIVVVLAAVAAMDWLQASFLAFYTPPGINVRLIKAAIWLTAVTIALFYTALLHTFPKKRYGRRSRTLFLLLPLASVYVLGERREAYRPPTEAAPLESLVRLAESPKLFVVGLEGASLEAILPLAQQGQLPFFSKLLEEGTHARLEPLTPIFRTAVWTSLVTGKYPYKHGVLSENSLRAEFLPGRPRLTLLPWRLPLPARLLPGLEAERPDASLRRNLALWEIHSRMGFSTGVISWPSLYPVTETSAFSFSERYFAGNFSAVAALPPELAERGALFQVGLSELDQEMVEEFGQVPPEILTALAADVWRESLANFLLQQRRDLRRLFILLPGIDEASRQFLGGFSAFELAGIKNDRRRLAAQVVTAYYRHIDGYLAELWEREQGPKLIAVLSPYGRQAPSGWRRILYAMMGRSDEGIVSPPGAGIMFLMGEGIRPGLSLDRVNLLDVMPTLLYASKLPISRDLDGNVLVDAFDSSFLAQTPLAFVPSYETLVGEPPSLDDDAISRSARASASPRP